MTQDQSSQFWIGKRTIIEVSAQRQDDNERSARLRRGGDQQVDELLAFVLTGSEGEEFLELVDQQDDSLLRGFYQLSRQPVQAACRIILQVFTNRCDAAVGQMRSQREG